MSQQALRGQPKRPSSRINVGIVRTDNRECPLLCRRLDTAGPPHMGKRSTCPSEPACASVQTPRPRLGIVALALRLLIRALGKSRLQLQQVIRWSEVLRCLWYRCFLYQWSSVEQTGLPACACEFFVCILTALSGAGRVQARGLCKDSGKLLGILIVEPGLWVEAR